MALLSDAQIEAALADLDDWQRAGSTLRRSVEFAGFLEGIDAVTRVAEHAEAADHHPDIDIRWRTVTFTLSTHSHGGVTEKDVALARRIDAVIARR